MALSEEGDLLAYAEAKLLRIWSIKAENSGLIKKIELLEEVQLLTFS